MNLTTIPTLNSPFSSQFLRNKGRLGPRSVATACAPSAAATMPTSPHPALRSRTCFPATTSGWASKNFASTMEESQTVDAKPSGENRAWLMVSVRDWAGAAGRRSGCLYGRSKRALQQLHDEVSVQVNEM